MFDRTNLQLNTQVQQTWFSHNDMDNDDHTFTCVTIKLCDKIPTLKKKQIRRKLYGFWYQAFELCLSSYNDF